LQGQNARICEFRDQILNDHYLEGLNTYKSLLYMIRLRGRERRAMIE